MPRIWRIPTEIAVGLAVLCAAAIVIEVMAGFGNADDLFYGAALLLIAALFMVVIIDKWEEQADRNWREDWKREHDPQYDAIMNWVESVQRRGPFQLIRWVVIPIVAAVMFWVIFRR